LRVPWLAYLGAVSQAAPLVAAALVRRPVWGPRAWVLAWCAVLVAVDAASLWLASQDVRNLWLFNSLTPASVAVVLWALSLWQTGDLTRLTMRIAILPFLLLWTVLTLAFEDTSAFSRAADPMASIVGLGAAAFTLLARSRSASGALLRHDWFWVSAGMALYFGTSSALSPLSALLVREAPQLVIRAYEVKSLLDVLAFLLIARGVTCPAET